MDKITLTTVTIKKIFALFTSFSFLMSRTYPTVSKPDQDDASL